MRAHTGMEGYRLAFTSPASAILLDFNMPDGQGDYILGRLKDNLVTRDIPVIIITGVKDKVLERRMLGLGAAAFFVKPVSFDQLKEQLSRYISMVDVPEGLLVTDKRKKKAHRIAQEISKPAETLQKSI
jgi:response regulator RpfG family c-di-GMP phosphodiesterase